MPSDRVKAFLTGMTEKAKVRGRLIFAMDATASREHVWDMSVMLQADMFKAAAAIGGLDIQLLYYRGMAGSGGECRASGWTDNPLTLAKLMGKIRCLSGMTQIGRVLQHALRESHQNKVHAMVFVGDAAEESRGHIAGLARELGSIGTPAFMFQEGDDHSARACFHEIALLTGGAYQRFDDGSAKALRELLLAVAIFATGGTLALERHGSSAARLLLGQIGRKGK